MHFTSNHTYRDSISTDRRNAGKQEVALLADFAILDMLIVSRVLYLASISALIGESRLLVHNLISSLFDKGCNCKGDFLGIRLRIHFLLTG